MQQFRGGLVFKDHRLCVSLNSRLESKKEEEEASDSVASVASDTRESIARKATSLRGEAVDGHPHPTTLSRQS